MTQLQAHGPGEAAGLLPGRRMMQHAGRVVRQPYGSSEHPRSREVQRRGILDYYRRDQGLPDPPSASAQRLESHVVEPPRSLLQAAGTIGSLGLGEAEAAAAAATQQLEVEQVFGECPVNCVRSISTLEEFNFYVQRAPPRTVVVLDLYRTACAACRYIAPKYAKLCRSSLQLEVPAIFLSHNVFNEYDEPSDLAEELGIKLVPTFMFFKGGACVETFASRDRLRISAAVSRHALGEVPRGPASAPLPVPRQLPQLAEVA